MKRFTLLFFTLSLCLSATSQITTAWTTTQPTRQLPSGFTAPVVTPLEDFQQATFSITIIDTIDNASASTGLTRIGNKIKMEIDSNYVVEVFGLNPANDITGRIVITDILRRWNNFEPKDYKNQYKLSTGIFRVRGKFQWVTD